MFPLDWRIAGPFSRYRFGRVGEAGKIDLTATVSWVECVSTKLKVGIDLTISSPFTEEPVDAPEITRGSKALEFLGGLALGFAPILLLIYIEIFTNLMLDSLIQIFISTILVIGGSAVSYTHLTLPTILLV